MRQIATLIILSSSVFLVAQLADGVRTATALAPTLDAGRLRTGTFRYPILTAAPMQERPESTFNGKAVRRLHLLRQYYGANSVSNGSPSQVRDLLRTPPSSASGKAPASCRYSRSATVLAVSRALPIATGLRTAGQSIIQCRWKSSIRGWTGRS
jgi:hypothetical protein